MFMSTKARKRYMDVQEAIALAVDTQSRSTTQIRTSEYDAIRKACSRLRTAMTRDLLSRRGAPFRW
jgi:hypothetical protein